MRVRLLRVNSANTPQLLTGTLTQGWQCRSEVECCVARLELRPQEKQEEREEKERKRQKHRKRKRKAGQKNDAALM